MYRYNNKTRKERQKNRKDHCNSNGNKYNLDNLILKGHIRNPHDNQKLLTTQPLNEDKLKNRYIYAVSREWYMRIALDGYRGKLDAVKHETLFHNASVRAAGEIYIEDGIIEKINDHSGTYLTFGKLHSFSKDIIEALNKASNPMPIAKQELSRLRKLK